MFARTHSAWTRSSASLTQAGRWGREPSEWSVREGDELFRGHRLRHGRPSTPGPCHPSSGLSGVPPVTGWSKRVSFPAGGGHTPGSENCMLSHFSARFPEGRLTTRTSPASQGTFPQRTDRTHSLSVAGYFQAAKLFSLLPLKPQNCEISKSRVW